MATTVVLFGGPRVEKGDVPTSGGFPAAVGFPTRKAASLAALLALSPERFVSREWVAEMLWPEQDPEWQRARLRNELALLGRALGPDSLVRQGRSAVGLSADVQTDVGRFRDLLRAASLARPQAVGMAARIPLLIEAVRAGGEDLMPGYYEEPLLAHRERLREEWWEAVGALVASLRQLGRAEEAEYWRQIGLTRFPDRNIPVPPQAAETRAARSSADRAAPPTYASPFFGRGEDLAHLRAWRENGQSHLLTITGMGGFGKTRLVAQAFPDAVFVALSGVFDGALLRPTLCKALGFEGAVSDLAWQTVLQTLRFSVSLLVLDNVEQIVEPAAELVRELREAAPDLRIVVTSRSRLELDGEEEYPLRTLDATESRALFLSRARAVRPDFPDTGAEIDALCAMMEGIPLAIELAASRALVLGPAQMRIGLADRMNFLVSRRRDLPERHQGMRAAIEWSVDLLPASLRHLFFCLCVFPGTFSLEAADAICGGKSSVLDGLESLRAHSLLVVVPVPDAPNIVRYCVLETLRAYGMEHLPADEREGTEERFAAWYAGVVAKAAATLRGLAGSGGGDHAVGTALNVVRGEMDNLCAALRWLARKGCRAPAEHGGWELADFARDLERLVFSLEGFGGAWAALEEAVAQAGAEAPPELLFHAGGVALHCADYPAAEELLARAERGFREADREASARRARDLRAYLAIRVCRFERADALLTEAAADYKAERNRARLAYVYNLQALLAAGEGRLAHAITLNRLSRRLYREENNAESLAYVNHDLAIALILRKDFAAARDHLYEALATFREREEREGMAFCLEAGAAFCAATGEGEAAARLLGAAARMRREASLPLPPYDLVWQQPFRWAVVEELAPDVYRQAFSEGEAADFRGAARLLEAALTAAKG